MDKFKYTIDKFADIKIIRYPIPNFNNLNLKQKEYVFYLSEAAKSGRDILWEQKNPYNLTIRKTLENILKTYEGNRTTKSFKQFLVYTKRVFFSNGINHHYAHSKIFPECSRKYFKQLLNLSSQSSFPVLKNQTQTEFSNYILDIIYKKENLDGDLIKNSHTNFYRGVNESEAKAYYDNLAGKKDSRPLAHGLNSLLIKEDNTFKEIIYSEKGLYSKAIKKIIYWLEKAMNVAENEIQKNYTKLLIEYYRTGDLKTWDEYNVAWCQDKDSTVDYVNGFIESYEDPIGIKATWEALVNIRNEEETKITKIIADNAQWFEDNSPIPNHFKKKKVKGISAKVIDAVTLGGDCYPSAPIGINLPNSNWIREEYGSKSVTISNLTKAISSSALENRKSAKKEFCFSNEQFEFEKKLIDFGDDIHTHLHECLGHGSGILLPGVSINDLKENQSSLEEARADLFALYYMADTKLVELKVISTTDVAQAYYNAYIRSGIQVQLARIELGKNVVQAHMQARKLISTWAFELGKKTKVIEKKIKDNKTYFVVNNHLKLRDIFGTMLSEIQRIKSEGDYQAGKKLIDKYATKVDYNLHKEVIERYKKLNLKPYIGFINPEIICIKENNKIIDYQIQYPKDFLKQQLEYGNKYSFL